MGLIITLLVLLLLAILPFGVSAIYNADGPLIRLIAGPARITLYPVKKKDKSDKPKKKKEKKPKAEPQAKDQAKPQDKQKGGPISDFYPFITLVLDLLTDFRRKLRLDRFELKIILAGGDPADLGINYGRAWIALGNLWPMLERVFVIKKRDVEVECDFEGSSTTISARLDLTITLGRLFSMGFRYGIRGLKEFINFKNKRKAGTAK